MLLVLLLPLVVLPPVVYKIPGDLLAHVQCIALSCSTHSFCCWPVPGSNRVQGSRRSPCLSPTCCIQVQHTLIKLLPVWLLPVVKAWLPWMCARSGPSPPPSLSLDQS